jgi:hypothetical protein
MRLIGLLPLAVVLAACATTPPPASPATPTAQSTDAGATPGPVTVTDADGRFRLDFQLPRRSFTEGEAIEGTAVLSLLGPGKGQVGASGGGPIVFGIREITGTRQIGPASRASCGLFPIGEGAPITSGIVKSGGWNGEDANAAFFEAFFRDPELHLPAGTWEITAYASFSEGDCGPNPHELHAPIRIEVAPGP